MAQVVLVDKRGGETGLMEKLKAHRKPGYLHKAVSVVLYRRVEGGIEVLIQKRSKLKPLWPLFWANTVCTHPLPGENNLDCAVRRLKEEVGIEMAKADLKELYTFNYQADYSDEYSEHEVDAVIAGEYDGEWKLDPKEAAGAKWVEWGELKKDLDWHPEIYAPWPKLIFKDKRLMNGLGENGD